MAATPETTDLFRFMEVRPPFSPGAKALRQNYVRDDVVDLRGDKPARIDVDFQVYRKNKAYHRTEIYRNPARVEADG